MSMSNTEKTVKDIRRKTRRKFSTEEKIRIVLDGLRGESSVAELCRQEGINPNLCITAGAKTSLRLARNAYPEIPYEKPIPMRSRISRARTRI